MHREKQMDRIQTISSLERKIRGDLYLQNVFPRKDVASIYFSFMSWE